MKMTNRTKILDTMCEVSWTIDFYKSKVRDNKSMIKKYCDLQFFHILSMYEKRIQAQERLVRILEIRFEKLKQQL